MGWQQDGFAQPTNATTIDVLRPLQAFLLLGELGVGKTWLFEQEAARLRAQAHQNCIFVRLGEFSTLDELDRETFGQPDVRAAVSGANEAHLFLDSLDQGLIQNPTLHHWIARQCRDLRLHPQIRIRVSSRILPEALMLEAKLTELYQLPEREISYYVGALTRDEIVSEAASRSLDGQRFVKIVSDLNAELLATHPLTLDLLLGQYGATRKLTADLVQLYRDACHTLTEEHEASQLADAPARGELAYVLTGRVAATMALAGKPLISAVPRSNRPDASIGVEEITSLPEEVNGQRVEVSDEQVRYILTTALFQSDIPHTYRWAHNALQDFMAAEWTAQRLDPEQIQGLLAHPLDSHGQVRTDLEEMAAWLAGIVPSIRRYLVRVQPLVLLTSQSQVGARAAPDELLRALLKPENAMLVRWRNVRDIRLRRLRGPHTSGILRPALATGSDLDVQWLAIAVIRQLRLTGFDAELGELLRNPAVAEFVAVSAGLALEAVGTTKARRQLAKRLDTPEAPQLPDEIKAVLIRATWPKFLSGATLFRVLTPPTDGVVGLYDTLPADRILESLVEADLPPALDWVALEPFDGYIPENRRKLVHGIIRQASSHLDNAAVRLSMVQLMVALGRSEFGFREPNLLAPLFGRLSSARALFADAVNTAGDPLEFVKGMYWQAARAVISLGWLLIQRQRSRSESAKAAGCGLPSGFLREMRESSIVCVR
jgi:hypothetical protein